MFPIRVRPCASPNAPEAAAGAIAANAFRIGSLVIDGRQAIYCDGDHPQTPGMVRLEVKGRPR